MHNHFILSAMLCGAICIVNYYKLVLLCGLDHGVSIHENLSQFQVAFMKYIEIMCAWVRLGLRYKLLLSSQKKLLLSSFTANLRH